MLVWTLSHVEFPYGRILPLFTAMPFRQPMCMEGRRDARFFLLLLLVLLLLLLLLLLIILILIVVLRRKSLTASSPQARPVGICKSASVGDQGMTLGHHSKTCHRFRVSEACLGASGFNEFVGVGVCDCCVLYISRSRKLL